MQKNCGRKKEYIYEHQSGMDEADKVSADQSVNRMVSTGESAVARKRKMLNMHFNNILLRTQL
jgi:DNA helicase II / ATP-dependent DNA helicase PcrA